MFELTTYGVRNPTEMHNHSLSTVVTSYVEALRGHQAHGPYHLGGWSAGGILAYAVAQDLISTGEQVSSLVLIDSPAPTRGLDRLPQRFFDHCSQVGIFGSEMTDSSNEGQPGSVPTKVPEWLMPHFEATIEILHNYHAPPMSRTANMPRVSLIWAEECALDGVRYAKLPSALAEDEDTEGMKFLTEKRADFGPGEWADLFPGQEIRVEVARGQHHFSMMKGRGAEQLSRFIASALIRS